MIDRVIITVVREGERPRDVELAATMGVSDMARALPSALGWEPADYDLFSPPDRRLRSEITLAVAGVWDGAVVRFAPAATTQATAPEPQTPTAEWRWRPVR